MTREDRRQVTDCALDAIAANSEQDRLIHNPSEEIDSITEHSARLMRLTSGEARAHAAEIFRLAASLRNSNLAERASVTQIPQLVEAPPRWGVKTAATALRPVLTDISNRIVTGPRREAAEQQLSDLLDVIPAGLLMVGDDIRPSLVNELRVAKSTTLRAAILARRQAATS